MKKTNKLKIVFNRIFNKLFRTSNIEELELQKQQMEEILNNVNEEKNRLKGLIKVKREELVEKRITKNHLEEKIQKYIGKNNMEKAKEGFEYKQQLDKEIDRLSKEITAYEQIIKSTEKQIKIYQTKINKVVENIEELKAKAEFTNNAQTFRDNLKSMDCKDVKDISDEINRDYYAENFALEDIAKQDDSTIDAYIEADNQAFEKYINKVKGKKCK